MMLTKAKQYIDWLQLKNYKSFYLAFLRVAISLWLLKEVAVNWGSMGVLYGQAAFTVPRNTILGGLPGGFLLVKQYYMWFIATYAAVIFFNIFGIGRWCTAVVLFMMEGLLQKMNLSFINGGNNMARVILLYLVFADSYQYFVLFKSAIVSADRIKLKNLVSNLAALSIMLQLCVAYFVSGIAKIQDALWWHGEATYYALSMERFAGTPLNNYIVQHAWVNIASNYAVLLFELLFPFLIWKKKIRKPLLLAGFIFHMGIYVFLMIYGFQIVFILIYGLFIPNQTMLYAARKIKYFFAASAKLLLRKPGK